MRKEFSRTLIVSIVALINAPIVFAQPDTLWTKTFGGSDTDQGYSVQQTSDGGYILTGVTNSYGAGESDAWLIETNAFGDTLWTKTFGGSEYDYGYSVQQAGDGGYIITGNTGTYGPGEQDVWLIKTDTSGDTAWTRTFGGQYYNEEGWSGRQTSDGGYIIAGETGSYGAGEDDAWLIKTDASGDTAWTKTFGGSDDDHSYSVQQTSDGGYIITGETRSYGQGYWDVWLIKTDASGDTVWTKTFGGSDSDHGQSVQQTSDGGYIIAGISSSYHTGLFDSDVWLIKTDTSGDTVWTKNIGGDSNDEGQSVRQTSDGGYIITGSTASYGAGNYDVWLIKTDESGDTLWTKTFGGANYDEGFSVQETSDSGYVVTGRTSSYGAGGFDVWLIRLTADKPAGVVANFTADVTSGTAPLTVQFTDQSTGNPTSWSWDFGDDSTSTDQNPSHTYQDTGSFTVALTVSDGTESDTETKTDYITVTETSQVSNKMYWTVIGIDKIQRSNLDGSDVEDLVTSGLDSPHGIALDIAGGKMYWIESSLHLIQRANLDGSDVEKLITINYEDRPEGIALDLTNGKMYWTEQRSKKIRRADLDGSNIEDLITTDLEGPVSIALDLAGGKMYWTELPWFGTEKISRASLDGSSIEDLVTYTDNPGPQGIALDLVEGKMYWTESYSHKIRRANLNGGNIEDLVTTGGPHGIALDLNEGKMYWTDWGFAGEDDKIRRANLDGSNVEDLVTTNIHSPWGIALDVEAVPVTVSAGFTADVTSGVRPLAVQFTDQSYGGIPTSWSWDFGDDSTSIIQNPSHTYDSLGTYSVSLIVSDGTDSDTLTKTDYIRVYESLEIDTLLSESFEGSVTGWILMDNDGDGNEWSIYQRSDAAHTGEYGVGVYYNWDGNDDWLIAPKIYLPEDLTLTFSFWARSDLESALEDFNVRLSTAGTDTSEFSVFLDRVTDVPNEWEEYSYEVSSYGGDSVYLAIQCVSDNDYYLYADDFLVAALTEIAVEWEYPHVPSQITLYQNYPNPFNVMTTVRYDLPFQSEVKIMIFDILGRHVRTLRQGIQGPGTNTLTWNGRDDYDKPVSTGIYLYQIQARQPSGVGQAGNFTQTRKMVLLR